MLYDFKFVPNVLIVPQIRNNVIASTFACFPEPTVYIKVIYNHKSIKIMQNHLKNNQMHKIHVLSHFELVFTSKLSSY